MLQAPDSPWGTAKDGRRYNVSRSLQLVPELNVKQLSEGPEHLLALFKGPAQHAVELAAMEREHGPHLFQGDLEQKDVEYVSRLHSTGKIPRRTMLQKGHVIGNNVADDMLLRLSTLLANLTLFGDGYRQDVLGKEGSKYTATSLGCANCDATDKEGGRKLLLCAVCGVAAYCSKRCQTAHWKAGHKAVCHRRPRTEGVAAGSGSSSIAGGAAAAETKEAAAAVEALPSSDNGRCTAAVAV
jgi:hypothetical protein